MENTTKENSFLNILAAKECVFEHPTVNPEAVEAIAKNAAGYLYENVHNPKNNQISIKRLLKFLHSLCKVPVAHTNVDYYQLYLDQKSEPEISLSLGQLQNCSNVHQQVSNHYKRVNKLRRDKLRKLRKSNSIYETSQQLIDDLLPVRIVLEQPVDTLEAKYKEVELLFALTNLGATSLEIESKISNWSQLRKAEKQFIDHLINKDDFDTPIIVEVIIINLCKNVLKLRTDEEFKNYLQTNETTIKKVRKSAEKSMMEHYKIQNLLFELYVLSKCNTNVLNLSKQFKEF